MVLLEQVTYFIITYKWFWRQYFAISITGFLDFAHCLPFLNEHISETVFVAILREKDT